MIYFDTMMRRRRMRRIMRMRRQGLIRAELVVYKWISYAALLNCEHTIAHCTMTPWH